MATRSFGVKEINIIGPSVGTPTIQSPGNLNLEAATVAISTNLSIGGQVTSNIKIASGYSVGIGTTTPTSNLQVIGNVLVSDTITATNGFTSGIGTAVSITTVDNTLTFTVAGVGSTSLTLY
jgi:hypothetical protein